MNQRAWRGLGALLCVLACAAAHATPEYQNIFGRTYNPAKGTPLEQASCKACHVAAGPPKRNAFGAEVQKALEAAGTKTLTEGILRQTEAVDPDGDGASSGDEMAAGTLPGDAESVPEKAVVAAAVPAQPDAEPAPTTTPKTPARPEAAAPKAKPAPPADGAGPAPAKRAAPAAHAAAKPAPPSGQAPAAKPRTTPPERASAPAALVTAPAKPPADNRPAPAVVASAPDRAEPAPPAGAPEPEPSRAAAIINRLVPPHSYHPVIVHFPIALFLFGGICEVLGAWKRRPVLRTTGALNMTAASVTSLGAMGTGFLAMWRSGFPLSGLVLVHLLLAVAATATMAATAIVGWSFTKPSKERASLTYWFLLGASLLLVGAAGHFGGELVYGS